MAPEESAGTCMVKGDCDYIQVRDGRPRLEWNQGTLSAPLSPSSASGGSASVCNLT